jgi:hypothetical protein
MSTADVHARFTSRDPLLLAALYAGDVAAVEAVFRLLRLTPLTVLARDMAALVEVLAAVPELHDRLRSCWSRQDRATTATLFGWVEQARLRVRRADHDAPATSPAQRAAAFMRAEELALAS